ncbi:hypothetical protein PF005_g28304 [Phytophthora fragariae]|uniref:RxLR effector PexRD54 WY domain-containing protein n=2 Tax=Phytophthora fragariae TaxID=53985 RepID=A0A6A3VMT0_9STRA|nr:hypothetical protein PF003_g33013 [Phytophthora fragariae]KAE9168607.1 hypothetical protein PF005_g28304 [Phytophthora fragariae]
MARKRSFALLATVAALLACFGPVTEVTASGPATSFPAGGEDHNGVQTHRRLRSNVWTTVEEDDDSSEERGLDKIPGVAKIVEKLTPDKQKAANKLFTKLKLHETTSDLFESPNFHKWIKSVTKAYKKTPDAANAVIVSTITARYGDEALARMLVAAKEVPTTRNLATQLEEVQLANWLTSMKTADDVFKLLKLDDEGVNLFKNPVFSTWVSYATKLDDKNPDTLMFSVLKARYDDDVLADIFIAAKETRSTRRIAARQESILFAKWTSDRKTADDAFKLLKLNPNRDDFLKSPALDFWISYVKMLGEDPYKLILATLPARYTDEGLASMLVMAKEDHTTASITSKLEDAQSSRWLSQGENARLDKKNPDKLMLSALKTSYNDEKLASMLISAQKIPRTKGFAARMQDELWISEGKTADDIFQLLKLNRENMFDSGELSTWVSYVTKLNKLDDRPDEFAVISELQERFGNAELAMMISAALIRSDPNKNIIKSLQTLQFKRSTGVFLNYVDFYRANK